MRIVTLNTWKCEGDYARRLELMAEALLPLEADVICLQESFAAHGFDTANHLAQALGLYAYARPGRRKRRLLQGVERPSTSGLAMLTSKPLAREAALSLESDAEDGERIAQAGDISFGAASVRIVNLHLTHLRDAQILRARQLEASLEWALTDWNGDLVLAGDLNASRQAPELAALRQARPGPQGPTLRGPDGCIGRRDLDHCVLVRSSGAVVRESRLVLAGLAADGAFASDHAGLMITLDWPQGEPRPNYPADLTTEAATGADDRKTIE